MLWAERSGTAGPRKGRRKRRKADQRITPPDPFCFLNLLRISRR
jgi:hypothetical protein